VVFDPPLGVAVALVAAATLLYCIGAWTRRGILGLGAFQTALRRRRSPIREVGVESV
jgi:hypothetical protein